MTSQWIVHASQNLLPLSEEQKDLRKALREWFYTRTTYDLEHPVENCQLCDHSGIRFQFEIKNQNTDESLLIGSECIRRFAIASVDDDGNEIDHTLTYKNVQKDRRQLINDARTKRVITALIQLAQTDQEFDDLDRSIEYFQDRGAFSPNHLAFLLWRLKKNKISYSPADFKMIIQRGREKDQLRMMEDWKIKSLWQSMSASQKKWCKENLG